MPETLRKVSPGEKWRPPPADLHNLVVDMVETWMAQRSLSQQDINFGGNPVQVYNANADTVPKFGVVGLGTPTFAPTENEGEFIGARSFNGVLPGPGSNFAITQDLIQPDTIGPARVMGVTQARVSIASYLDRYAQPAGTVEYLASTATATGCEILWANQAGTELVGDIGDSDTVISVENSQGYLAGMLVSIGDETLLVTDVDGPTWTVTRGYNSTTAASHASGDAIGVEGGVVWATVRLCCPDAADEEPETVHFFHDEDCIVYGAALQEPPTIDAAQIYGYTVTQSPCADDDETQAVFVLKGGTYTLFTRGQTTADSGIVEWQIDGEIIGFQDWYSASTVKNVRKSISGVVLASGRHVLTKHVNGKNASSSGYCAHLTKSWLVSCPAHGVGSGSGTGDGGGTTVTCNDCILPECIKVTVPETGNTSICQFAEGQWVTKFDSSGSNPIANVDFPTSHDNDLEVTCTWTLGQRVSYDLGACYDIRVDVSLVQHKVVSQGSGRDAAGTVYWQAAVVVRSAAGCGILAVGVWDQYANDCTTVPASFGPDDWIVPGGHVPSHSYQGCQDALVGRTLTVASTNCDLAPPQGCLPCVVPPNKFTFVLNGTPGPATLSASWSCPNLFTETLTATAASSACVWELNKGCGFEGAYITIYLAGGNLTLTVFSGLELLSEYTAVVPSDWDCNSCLTLTRVFPTGLSDHNIFQATGGTVRDSRDIGNWAATMTLCAGDGDPNVTENCGSCDTVPALFVAALGATATDSSCQAIFDAQITVEHDSECHWSGGGTFLACGTNYLTVSVSVGTDVTYNVVATPIRGGDSTTIATYTVTPSALWDCLHCIELERTLPAGSGDQPDSLGIAMWPDTLSLCPGDGGPNDPQPQYWCIDSACEYGTFTGSMFYPNDGSDPVDTSSSTVTGPYDTSEDCAGDCSVGCGSSSCTTGASPCTLGTPITGNATGAYNAGSGDPNGEDPTTAGAKWYKFTVVSGGTYPLTIEANGGACGAVACIYSGSCESLVHISCTSGGVGTPGTSNYSLTPGDYFVQVLKNDGCLAGSVSFTLTLG